MVCDEQWREGQRQVILTDLDRLAEAALEVCRDHPTARTARATLAVMATRRRLAGERRMGAVERQLAEIVAEARRHKRFGRVRPA